MNMKPVLLSDFFSSSLIHRDSKVSYTMLPDTNVECSVCYATDERQLKKVQQNPCIVAVITMPEMAEKTPNGLGCVIETQPAKAYYDLHNFLVRERKMSVQQTHDIHPSAKIASSARIGRNVVIGKGVVIEEYAVIQDYSCIGNGAYVGEAAIIGARGMQNLRVDGKKYDVEFAGGVRIGANSEILSGAIIQRPYQAFFTEIGSDCQISVNVVVGHGSSIGSRSQIAGSVQIAGNVKIGRDAWIGPSCSIADSLAIGDGARIIIGSTVVENIKSGETVSGNFAIRHTVNLRNQARIRNEN